MQQSGWKSIYSQQEENTSPNTSVLPLPARCAALSWNQDGLLAMQPQNRPASANSALSNVRGAPSESLSSPVAIRKPYVAVSPVLLHLHIGLMSINVVRFEENLKTCLPMAAPIRFLITLATFLKASLVTLASLGLMMALDLIMLPHCFMRIINGQHTLSIPYLLILQRSRH